MATVATGYRTRPSASDMQWYVRKFRLESSELANVEIAESVPSVATSELWLVIKLIGTAVGSSALLYIIVLALNH